jgi:hypothetical protein
MHIYIPIACKLYADILTSFWFYFLFINCILDLNSKDTGRKMGFSNKVGAQKCLQVDPNWVYYLLKNCLPFLLWQNKKTKNIWFFFSSLNIAIGNRRSRPLARSIGCRSCQNNFARSKSDRCQMWKNQHLGQLLPK